RRPRSVAALLSGRFCWLRLRNLIRDRLPGRFVRLLWFLLIRAGPRPAPTRDPPRRPTELESAPDAPSELPRCTAAGYRARPWRPVRSGPSELLVPAGHRVVERRDPPHRVLLLLLHQ